VGLPTAAERERSDQFAQLVEQLRSLRDRGMIRLPDRRIMREQGGPLLIAGPCELTRKGWQALEQDRGGRGSGK
jgi:hypothetical protein